MPPNKALGAACESRLRWVSDGAPGITRHRRGRGFAYRAPDGEPITDARTLQRIRAVAIPPAWTDVWICPSERGHIQATGRDARGRKQYRYHPRWREFRDEQKYNRMVDFGTALPRIRRRVTRDLQLAGLPRERVLATVVRLLDVALIRIGNIEYTRANRSYGLTTLRSRQLRISGSCMRFAFRSKSGRKSVVSVEDRRVARVLRRCTTLPGEELFEYLDENNQPHPISSDDVNEYLRTISGEDFSAKDFRTWAGTVLAARALADTGTHASAIEARHHLVAAIASVAARLSNTPAVCRRSYVHPELIKTHFNGRLSDLAMPTHASLTGNQTTLSADERAVLTWLQAGGSERPRIVRSSSA